MKKMFNELTAGEVERLAILAEEMAETIQEIGKILRFGFENYHLTAKYVNREHLEMELGHVLWAVDLMKEKGDVSKTQIKEHAFERGNRPDNHLYHQRD